MLVKPVPYRLVVVVHPVDVGLDSFSRYFDLSSGDSGAHLSEKAGELVKTADRVESARYIADQS